MSDAATVVPDCRFCSSPLETTMVDLGLHPPCERFLIESQLTEPEPFYPLHVRVCGKCFLAQIEHDVSPRDIFGEYAYFSSFSTAWLKHAERYAKMAVKRFGLDATSNVLEIASNDGYLLQYFQARGIRVLGIDPAANVAAAATKRGIPTQIEFFGAELGKQLAAEGFRADLLVANNVLAHTPDLNGFVEGVATVLAERGVATFEFPHLMQLMAQHQFDTIYHEHWSYLSLWTVTQIFEAHGLTVFDVEELWTHGGSLRVFAQRTDSGTEPVNRRCEALIDRERAFGLFDLDRYEQFGAEVEATKRKIVATLRSLKAAGQSIVAYGAAGKGNTLLNYCGIGTDVIDYACDRNPYKHGRFTPGTHIPIYAPDRLFETRPDVVLILPWNLQNEIMTQLSGIAEWGGKFLIPIPEPTIYEAALA